VCLFSSVPWSLPPEKRGCVLSLNGCRVLFVLVQFIKNLKDSKAFENLKDLKDFKSSKSKQILALTLAVLGAASAVHAATPAPKTFEKKNGLENLSLQEMKSLLEKSEGTKRGDFLTKKIQEIKTKETEVKEAKSEEEKQKLWKCPNCTPNEKYVLEKLQVYAKITDRNALATIMGNIKQESKFTPNICEGGARVPYNRCHRGGYGLIQWTTIGRYNGLGNFCKKRGCNPSTLAGQTRYMINESQFQKNLARFRKPGRTIGEYMSPSYSWLGWGVKGPRQRYAYNYAKKLVFM